MGLKDIVVHQGPDARSPARLDAAVALAKRHDARIIGIFVRVDPTVPQYWWMGYRSEAVAEWLATLQRISEEAEEAFKRRMGEEGLDSEWRVMDGDPTDVMMTCARYGDLTVIGQTNPDEPAYEASMPDQLVLGAGTPVLVVPYAGHFGMIGRRVMIAWNGGREAARAVHDALPILEHAETVIVYGIDRTDDAHWAGADICAHLARHGVRAQASSTVLGPEAEAVSSALRTVGDFGSQQRGPWTQSRHPALAKADVGNALLSAAADCAADLLVMGAYGHSRVRELVLGGATREILATMTVPVLMSS